MNRWQEDWIKSHASEVADFLDDLLEADSTDLKLSDAASPEAEEFLDRWRGEYQWRDLRDAHTRRRTP